MDILTEFLRHVLVMLGARHKERLGTGIAVGLVILFIHSSLVAAGLLPTVSNIVSVVGSIALGVLIMFFPIWLNPKQRHIGEDEQKILIFMDELARRSGLTPVQKKLAYNEMLRKQIDHYYPGKPLELKKDAETAIEEAVNDNRGVLDNSDVKDDR